MFKSIYIALFFSVIGCVDGTTSTFSDKNEYTINSEDELREGEIEVIESIQETTVLTDESSPIPEHLKKEFERMEKINFTVGSVSTEGSAVHVNIDMSNSSDRDVDVQFALSSNLISTNEMMKSNKIRAQVGNSKHVLEFLSLNSVKLNSANLFEVELYPIINPQTRHEMHSRSIRYKVLMSPLGPHETAKESSSIIRIH